MRIFNFVVASLSPSEFKILTCLVDMTLALIGGYIPIKLNDHPTSLNSVNSPRNMLKSSLNMFAAGIFFSSSLLNFLPDAMKNQQLKKFMLKHFQSPNDNNNDDEYPWGAFFFAIGFILLLSFESMAHGLQNQFNYKSSDVANQPKYSIMSPSDDTSRHLYGSINDRHQYHSIHIVSDISENIDEGTELQSETTKKMMMSTRSNNVSITLNMCSSSSKQPQQQFNTPKIISFVAFVSLSFHSIMAGIGIGSQSKCTWSIFFAISVHKSLMAFSLGVELLDKVSNCVYALFILLFSIMTPFGILLGWGLTTIFQSQNDQRDIVSSNLGAGASTAICIALSGGTFLYISAVEIISKELKERYGIRMKLAALSFGFALIAILLE